MNKYIATYGNIILKARLENRTKSEENYYESHHITPRSLNGSNEPNNLVLLTAREHYLCHFLIYKYYKSIGDKPNMHKMVYDDSK